MDVVKKVENCKKGRGDKPEVKIVIAASGELPMEENLDENGAQIPLRAEL